MMKNVFVLVKIIDNFFKLHKNKKILSKTKIMCDNSGIVIDDDIICQRCKMKNFYDELRNGRLICLKCDAIIIRHSQLITSHGTNVDSDLFPLVEWLENNGIYINGNCQHQISTDKGDLTWINLDSFTSYDKLIKLTRFNDFGLQDVYLTLHNIRICVHDYVKEDSISNFDDLHIAYNFSWKFPTSKLKSITHIITNWKVK